MIYLFYRYETVAFNPLQMLEGHRISHVREGEIKMKKVSILLTVVIFMALMLASGIKITGGAEVKTDKDTAAMEGS